MAANKPNQLAAPPHPFLRATTLLRDWVRTRDNETRLRIFQLTDTIVNDFLVDGVLPQLNQIACPPGSEGIMVMLNMYMSLSVPHPAIAHGLLSLNEFTPQGNRLPSLHVRNIVRLVVVDRVLRLDSGVLIEQPNVVAAGVGQIYRTEGRRPMEHPFLQRRRTFFR